MGKLNVVLLAIFLGLCGLLLSLERPWATDRFEEAAARRRAPIFPGLDPSKAAKIELRQGKEEVVLARGADGWRVATLANFRANEDAVARLLDRIRAMTKGDLVTTDRANHAKYRLADADAPRITLRDEAGAVLADLLQGRPEFDRNEADASGGRLSSLDCYVRPAGADEVYRVAEFQPIEPLRASDWIPRNLYRFDVAAIHTLSISGTSLAERIELNRLPSGEWQLVTEAGALPASREACETLARSFSSVYVEDVLGAFEPKDAARYGFDAPRLRAFATLAGNANEELVVGADVPSHSGEADSAYATGGLARQHLAKVFKSSLEALKVTRSQLLPPAASQPAESGPASAPASAPGGK